MADFRRGVEGLVLHFRDEAVVRQKALSLRHPFGQGAAAQEAVLRLVEFLSQIVLRRRLLAADDLLRFPVDLQRRLGGVERSGEQGNAHANAERHKQGSQHRPFPSREASAIGREVEWNSRGVRRGLRFEVELGHAPGGR